MSQPVIGLRISNLNFEQVVNEAVKVQDKTRIFLTCNLNHLRVLQRDAGFRAAYGKADIVTIDGRPLTLLIRSKDGRIVPLITGADLFPAILKSLPPVGFKPFFVTSSEAVGLSLQGMMVSRGFASAAVQYSSPQMGFEDSNEQSARLINRIIDHQTTHLFMGIGAPKSEKWVAKQLSSLPVCNVFCFGASLDFAAGLRKRAPGWMRQAGLEWLHRAAGEPRRLGGRYVKDAVFLAQVLAGKSLLMIHGESQ